MLMEIQVQQAKAYSNKVIIITVHVTKVYFIQLVLKIKYVEFEDNPDNFF